MGQKTYELTTETKEVTLTLSESVKIKALERVLNIPRPTIRSVLRNYKRTGLVENLRRRGRKKKFTNRDRNSLLRLVKANRRLTLQDITLKHLSFLRAPDLKYRESDDRIKISYFTFFNLKHLWGELFSKTTFVSSAVFQFSQNLQKLKSRQSQSIVFPHFVQSCLKGFRCVCSSECDKISK